MSTPAPDPGQLVRVRQRNHVVTAVLRSGDPDPAIHGLAARPQHLVSLTSVDDDGFGEEMQVIWEIEPGARPLHASSELPSPEHGVDEPARLDAFLDAVRWGGIASADVRALHAPFRSGIEIEDYQLDPVVRALQMPRVKLLLADDVGLGKTIEAGLVMQELILRHRARTVLVVCPAGLQVQWRDQMRDKFGLEFRIVDAETLRLLRRRRGLRVNPWTHFPRLITSFDYLKRDRPLRLFREVLPAPGEPAFPRKFDVLVVDEAHNVAPKGAARFGGDSQRTAMIRELSPHFEHAMFLSATPHDGYSESFWSLLELLDDQRFHRGLPPDEAQLRAVLVRRLKSELPPKPDGTPRFPQRVIAPIEVAWSEAERRAHAGLVRYGELRRDAGSDEASALATEFVLKLLKKRLFSSPEAFRSTLETHLASMTGRRAATRPRLSVLRREVEALDDEPADDETYEDWIAERVDTVGAALTALRADERAVLDELRRWAEDAVGRPDAKAAALIAWLTRHLKPEGEWTSERAIVFTEYRSTQKWLQQMLAPAGFRGARIAVLYGGMDPKQREEIKAAFQASPAMAEVRLLLATDAASEGIDLQNHCHLLVHHEIPWNPNRLEQRNGRIDRHGQQRAPQIFHFVPKGFDARAELGGRRPGDLEGDLEFLAHAALKVDRIREDLGTVGPVIAAQVEEAMLGRRARLEVAAGQADDRTARARRVLKAERDLRAEIARLRSRLDESRDELRLSPANIEAVVNVGLALARQPALEPVIVGRADGEVRAFRVPALRGAWAACHEGLLHPHSHEMRPIVFDPEAARGHDDVVLAHLNHRLVQNCLRLLRAEVWAPEGQRALRRVTARLVPDGVLDAPAVIAHARLVVLGGRDERLHEEVLAAGGLVRDGRFSRLNVSQLEAALKAQLAQAPPSSVVKALLPPWAAASAPLRAALEARMSDRTESLRRLLAERAEADVERLRGVLGELRRQLELHLDEQPAIQAALPGMDQDAWLREHAERYREAVARRVAEIPSELERESGAIRERFSNPSPRLFPVAVSWLLPESWARERA